MRIPFNVKYRPQIESGEYKVETKDGKQVRIVSWDKNGFECKEIVALVTNATGMESCNIYTIDGLLRSNSCQKNMNLFIVTPEQAELTGFESGLFSAFSDAWQQYLLGEKVNVVEWTKEHSAELLSLAREQFIKDGYVIEKKAFHDAVKKVDPKVIKEVSEKWDAMKEALRIEYERGKTDALKDIPKWRKFAPNINDTLSEQRICNELENSVLRVDVDGYCWIISREELNKLPKEDEK